MRVSLLQVGYGDQESVTDRVARVAELVAGRRGDDLVVLPELWAPGGFAYRDWAAREELLDGPVLTAIALAARTAGAWVHAGSVIERAAPGADPGPDGRGRWNTSALLSPQGELVRSYRKIHRFGFGVGEPRLLEAGEELVIAGPELAGRPPLPAVLGLATCYDLRFPELFRALLDQGAQIFVVPAAWPAPRVAAWSLLGRARAVENQCFVLACNTAGTHAGTRMGGRSQVVDPWGVVLAEAGEGEQVLTVELDPSDVGRAREAFPVLADRRLPALAGERTPSAGPVTVEA